MILLAGADVVLPDRIVSPGTLLLDRDRIIEVRKDTPPATSADVVFDLHGYTVVPGFVDVHVHGVDGADALDGGDAVQRIAQRLPRYGVTAFCPTSIACAPSDLRTLLSAVRAARTSPPAAAARVLPAHLESNFINPEYCGAQPLECLRLPRDGRVDGEAGRTSGGAFTADDILEEIETARPDVGIVTVAPELEGAIDLIRDLTSRGHRVSLGHSGASYEQALQGIAAGARHATHLFNRMTPIGHRSPGLTGAVLEHEDVIAEIICDGVHVHPSMVRVALAAKSPSGVMAITDGTAGSGLPPGSRTQLGGRPITVREAAYLDDGTLAGSVLTMDRAFALLVTRMGLSLVDAATICATTPARALNLQGLGVIAPGAIADVTVFGPELTVVQTWVAGQLAFRA
jgi:N-acetylglucosamine-6-phosphate deacetylase